MRTRGLFFCLPFPFCLARDSARQGRAGQGRPRSGPIRSWERAERSRGRQGKSKVGQEESDDETGKPAAVGCACACACALYIHGRTSACVQASGCENGGGPATDERPHGVDGMVCRGRTGIFKGASETDRRCYLFVARALTHRPVAATYPVLGAFLEIWWVH